MSHNPIPHLEVNQALIINSEETFPVRRVYCVGRNYAAHAREMGFDPDREPPFFFGKPSDTIVSLPHESVFDFPYPLKTDDLHYEAELVVVIGKEGQNISPNDALTHIWGYAIGLDMTRRDRQIEMREMGRPWEIGKAFDKSAPIGPIYPAKLFGQPKEQKIWLKVGDTYKQQSDLSQLIWSVPELISYLSELFVLKPGDFIFTGTPEGVGPVTIGDTLTMGIDDLGSITLQITNPS